MLAEIMWCSLGLVFGAAAAWFALGTRANREHRRMMEQGVERERLSAVEAKKAYDLAQARIREIEYEWKRKVDEHANQVTEARQALHRATLEHSAEIRQKVQSYEGVLATVEEDSRARERRAYEEGVQKGVSAFAFEISPYVKKVKKPKFLGLGSYYEIAIGHQFQLLINGVPALAPYITIVRHESVEEINEQVVAMGVNAATELVKALISDPGGKDGHSRFRQGKEIVKSI